MTPPGPSRDTRDSVDVVLAAERTDVEVHRVPRERVRLRREVVTEEVVLRVAVRREVLRVEHEPLGPSAVGTGGGATGPDGAALELVLSEERPVVELQVVPYERVRVDVVAVPGATSVTTASRREVADVTTEPARTPSGDPLAGPAPVDPRSAP